MEPIDELEPSLFELLAEQQLSSLLPPTIRYLLAVLTHRYPRYLLRVLNSYDEVYALAMGVVENHYLRTRGGSFTENFYGLKRERALASRVDLPRASSRAPFIVREQLQLGREDVWRNLLVLVAMPYLMRKLEEHHEINAPRALLGSAYTRLRPNPTLKDRLLHFYRWFLLGIYPRLHAAYGLVLVTFNLAYLSGNSRFHSPVTWLARTRIRRMGPADYKAIDDLGKRAAGRVGSGRSNASLLSPRNIGPKLLSGLSLALPASIFALKFLEWWYSSDFARQMARKAAEDLHLPVPLATGLDEATARQEDEGATGSRLEESIAGGGARGAEHAVADATNAPVATSTMLPILTVRPPAESDLCPICEDSMTTATACQTGVVYCYTCIHRWIEGQHPRQERFMVGRDGRWESGKGRCAVTGRRVLGGTEGLRRIMA